MAIASFIGQALDVNVPFSDVRSFQACSSCEGFLVILHFGVQNEKRKAQKPSHFRGRLLLVLGRHGDVHAKQMIVRVANAYASTVQFYNRLCSR